MTQDNSNGKGGDEQSPIESIMGLFSGALGGGDNQGSTERNSSSQGNGRGGGENDEGGSWGSSGSKQKSIKITPESVERTRKILDPNESTEDEVRPLVQSFAGSLGITDNKMIDTLTALATPIIGEHAPAIKEYHDSAEKLLKHFGLTNEPKETGGKSDSKEDSNNMWGGGENKKVASNDRNQGEDEEGEGRRVASNDRGDEDDDGRSAGGRFI